MWVKCRKKIESHLNKLGINPCSHCGIELFWKIKHKSIWVWLTYQLHKWNTVPPTTIQTFYGAKSIKSNRLELPKLFRIWFIILPDIKIKTPSKIDLFSQCRSWDMLSLHSNSLHYLDKGFITFSSVLSNTQFSLHISTRNVLTSF